MIQSFAPTTQSEIYQAFYRALPSPDSVDFSSEVLATCGLTLRQAFSSISIGTICGDKEEKDDRCHGTVVDSQVRFGI